MCFIHTENWLGSLSHPENISNSFYEYYLSYYGFIIVVQNLLSNKQFSCCVTQILLTDIKVFKQTYFKWWKPVGPFIVHILQIQGQGSWSLPWKNTINVFKPVLTTNLTRISWPDILPSIWTISKAKNLCYVEILGLILKHIWKTPGQERIFLKLQYLVHNHRK